LALLKDTGRKNGTQHSMTVFIEWEDC